MHCILFCSTKMSEVNKRKRKRVIVECLECGSQFNDDLKKKNTRRKYILENELILNMSAHQKIRSKVQQLHGI